MGILDGVKILEIAQWIALPGGSAILSDWGAEVIHVEHPQRGDALRGYLSSVAVGLNPDSTFNYIWELFNRGKKSVTVNLKSREGIEVIHRLAAQADVVMTNLRPYELEGYKLRYEDLVVLNPKVISVNLTGYGTRGPYSNSPGFDYAAFWARSGIMSSLGEGGGRPVMARPGIGDSVTALLVAGAVSGALFHRERNGIGQHVELSLFRTGVWTLSMDVQAALATGKKAVQPPRDQVANPLWNYYSCRDGKWLMLALLQPDPYWGPLCTAIGRKELETDPRFNSVKARRQNGKELVGILDEVFASRDRDEWREALDAQGIIWSPVQSVDELITDEQAVANGFFAECPDSQGKVVLTSPVEFSRAPARIRSCAPELGQNTEEVLLDSGFEWEEIESLRNKGAI